MPLRYTFPNNPEDFEYLCLMLFRVHWQCDNLEKYARRGQSQSGIDLIGNDGQGRACAIQCKHRDFNSALTKKEILAEIELAKRAENKLSRYAVATTAKRDLLLQNLAIAKTKEHRKKRLFSVEIYSWDDLVKLLNEYPDVARKIYGADLILYASLHQLPAAPRDFTGRDAELAELRGAIKKGNVAISGLRGMGGIGKTALALKLAEELTPSYPEA